MTLASIMRFTALSGALFLLVAGAAAAGHFHDDDTEVGHDCALCITQSLSLFNTVQGAPSFCLMALQFLLPEQQGPPLWALYCGCFLSRAPPASL